MKRAAKPLVFFASIVNFKFKSEEDFKDEEKQKLRLLNICVYYR